MKKLLSFLLIFGTIYYCVGCKLVESGTASINSTHSRMAQAGV